MGKFTNKVVVVTGGAKGIGKCICGEFAGQGANVCVIDLLDNPYFVGDIPDKQTLERFASKVIGDYGRVDVLINNALPLFKGIDRCSYIVLYPCSEKVGFITGETSALTAA